MFFYAQFYHNHAKVYVILPVPVCAIHLEISPVGRQLSLFCNKVSHTQPHIPAPCPGDRVAFISLHARRLYAKSRSNVAHTCAIKTVANFPSASSLTAGRLESIKVRGSLKTIPLQTPAPDLFIQYSTRCPTSNPSMSQRRRLELTLH